jgi:Fe-S cluster assembly iron-binding protein IscA
MKRLLFPLFFLAACSTGPSSETFIMTLDNLQPPGQGTPNVLEVSESIKVGELLKIRVSVAGGGCSGFDHFESKRTAERLELTPIGSRLLNVACTAEYSTRWADFSDDASALRSNPFTVIIHHAKTPDLERSVTITP